ncbi:hypothetical protein BDN71DRAFT_1191681 [Pleurotus eryngii]|uniref:Uncharacterized protein n=1 Tax=Pleurotus eryngii TaxID=5323 RepID=A0A9P6A600_PLEER|nr:hypothetical protein BDN71DRAFT_1191681 [Pleurotus eryngii]
MADQGNQGTPKTVRGVEFVSKDLIVPNSNIPSKVIVEFPKYGQSVKIRRMFDNESMDEEHGRMRLRKDGKIVLYNDSASVTSIQRGKWIKKLSTGEHYQVRHGDSIIFGSTEYEAKGSKPVRVEMRVIVEEYPALVPLSTASSEPNAHQQPAVHKRGPRRNKSDPNLVNTLERKKGNRKRLSAQPTLDKNLHAQQETPSQSRSLSPSPSRVVKQDVDKVPQIAVTPPKPAISKQDNNKPEATHRLVDTEIHKSSATQVKVTVSPPRPAVPRPGHRNNKSTSDLPGTSKGKRRDGQRPIERPSHLLDVQPEIQSPSTPPAQVVKPGIDQSSTAPISVGIAPPKLSAQVRRNNKSTSDLPDAKARGAQVIDDRGPSGHPNSRSQKHPPLSSRSPSPAAKV